ncbi:MAG: hypothetical protein CMB77_04910 [Euryarchaeota archaeon]|nr:hypothetical protein [Euryarchaeota archaeon]
MVGDVVRFAKWEEVDTRNSKNWPLTPKNHIGVLIEHDKLMGTTRILHHGEVLKVRPVFVEKAGKKDLLAYQGENNGLDQRDIN